MAPVAKNCDTVTSGKVARLADGSVTEKAYCFADLRGVRRYYVEVEMARGVPIRVVSATYGSAANNHQPENVCSHTIPWSSAFPTEPTLGEMIEAAEGLARGEWLKLFPECEPTA